jgi:long-chain fatty acid transport protein
MSRIIRALMVMMACMPCVSLAGGFLIYEHGASATGMADARTAITGDVNALYFNPAAITELEGLQLQVGTTGILPYVHYQAAGNPVPPRTYTRYSGEVVEVNDGLHDQDAKIKFYTPVHLYVAFRIPDTGISVGYGLNNPFGLGTHWPGDWDGRFITTASEMSTFFNQPVVAVDIAELAGFKDKLKLSLAVGYNFVYATALLEQHIDLRVAERLSADPAVLGAEGQMRMTGEAVGHGWNLALYAELPGLVAVGASLRSGVSLPFDGTVKFGFNPAGDRALQVLSTAIPEKTGGSVTIDLPMNMNFGLAFLGVQGLRVALDFYVSLFSSYDELDMKFDCVEAGTCDLDMDPMEADWGTSWQVSLGAEYMLTDALVVRAGYATSFSPVPDRTLDPSLPDGRQDQFCAGIGYHAGFWKVDVGYMLALWSVEKDNDVGREDVSGNPLGKANGRYSTVSHLLALSFSFSI